MSKAKYRCSGCGGNFVRTGFLNHIQLSSDLRCASARDHLRPTYPSTQNQETPSPSLEIDVEMADVDDTMSATRPEENNRTDSVDVDISMPDVEDNGAYGEHAQSALEEAPNFTTPPLNSHASVVFDSDEDDTDTDDDGDQDQAPRPEPGETPLSHRGVSGAETEPTAPEAEQTARAGGFITLPGFLILTKSISSPESII